MPLEGSREQGRSLDQPLVSIQYLRAIAALSVLTTHAFENQFQLFATLGGLGVDLFFLISGFLFVALMSDKTRPLDFIVDRVARIVPLYWILTLCTFGLLYSGVLGGEWRPWIWLGHIAFADHALLWQSLFFIPVENPPAGGVFPLIPQGWTLNFEMEFYVLFALALLSPRRLVVPFLTAVFLALMLLGVAFEGGVPFETWTSPIIMIFAFGMWVGLAFKRGWKFRWVFPALLVVWYPLVVFIFNHALGAVGSPERLVLLPLVLAVMMFAIWLEHGQKRLPESKSLRLMGDSSYSIYLWHFIPIILVNHLHNFFEVHMAAHFFLIFVPGLLGGLACYWVIELPIMRAYKRHKQRRIAAYLTSGMQAG